MGMVAFLPRGIANFKELNALLGIRDPAGARGHERRPQSMWWRGDDHTYHKSCHSGYSQSSYQEPSRPARGERAVLRLLHPCSRQAILLLPRHKVGLCLGVLG
jgi:hypothetical protein